MDGNRQNAAPINFKLVADILYNISDDLASSRSQIIRLYAD